MATNADPISVAQKRESLARVLDSRTFCRSEQLRAFLRYICEAEFEGRAQQLNEYVLGVSVLGRPAHYSPAEDSCVRSRAYELRNKLKHYYHSEAPEDPIRITIEKGAYVPRFELWVPDAPLITTPPGLPASPAELQETHETGDHNTGRPKGRSRRRWLSLVITALVASTCAYVIGLYQGKASRNDPRKNVPSPEMAALWKPFLESDAPLLLAFDLRPFFYAPTTGLVVRDSETNSLVDAAKSEKLIQFQQRMVVPELQVRFDYADFGTVHAAFLIGRHLHFEQRDVGLKHSSALGWDDVWNSNIIFLGKPNLNPAIRSILMERDFVEEQLGVIRNLHPLPGESLEYRSATTHGSGEKYALITVLPGPQLERRIMILAGCGAELMWALAEFVTSVPRVKEVVSHLRLPSGEFPSMFQVVIQATFESNVPLKIRYVTHRSSQKP